MNKCPNCNTAITCSCQVRVATDGQKVCSKCITSYEVAKKNSEVGLSIIKTAILPS